jgi:methionyl-tRNA synthetase
MKKILIGIAWPYVNGEQHIGHLAGYLLPADIFARFQRMLGNDVLMVSGSDCHGTPTTVQADKEGVTPQEIVDKYHPRDVKLFNQYGLSYNLYTKTTTDNHKEVVQELFMDLLENDFLVKGIMKQYYSQKDQKFLPDRYVEGECPYCRAKEQRSDYCEACNRWLEAGEIKNPVSKLSGSGVILKDTEHYFLDFSKAEKELKKFVDSRKDVWRKWILAETYGWLKEGLRKRAITRDLDWGVELPVEEIKKLPKEKQLSDFEGKRIYVWFDGVTGYISASIEWSKRISGQIRGGEDEIIFNKFDGQTSNWEDFWLNKSSKHYYFMGQDNLVFHTLMWPAQLIGSGRGYTLPYNVCVNKFMNYEGKKFSKSRNWTINSTLIAEEYGVDSVRYYIASVFPENKQGNFTWDGFLKAVNNELVANLGNFIHRTLSFIETKFKGIIPEGKLENVVSFEIREAFNETETLLEQVRLSEALSRIFKLVSFANKYFDKQKVWEIVKEDEKKAGNILYNCVQIINALRILLLPYLPSSAEKLRTMIGQETSKWQVGKNCWRFEETPAGTKLGKVEVLFKKLETEVVKRNVEKLSS